MGWLQPSGYGFVALFCGWNLDHVFCHEIILVSYSGAVRVLCVQLERGVYWLYQLSTFCWLWFDGLRWVCCSIICWVCQCVQYHFTLILVSLNNLVLNIYRMFDEFPEEIWTESKFNPGVDCCKNIYSPQPWTKVVLEFFLVLLVADEYLPLSSMSVAPTGLSVAAWLIIELKIETETCLKELAYLQLETSLAISMTEQTGNLWTDSTMTLFAIIFSLRWYMLLSGRSASLCWCWERERSETARWNDFLELWKEAGGGGLWSNPSNASLRPVIYTIIRWRILAFVSSCLRDSSTPSTLHISALTDAQFSMVGVQTINSGLEFH